MDLFSGCNRKRFDRSICCAFSITVTCPACISCIFWCTKKICGSWREDPNLCSLLTGWIVVILSREKITRQDFICERSECESYKVEIQVPSYYLKTLGIIFWKSKLKTRQLIWFSHHSVPADKALRLLVHSTATPREQSLLRHRVLELVRLVLMRENPTEIFFRAISNDSIFANSSLAPHPYYFHSRQLTNDITTSYRAMDIQTISSPLPSVPTKDLSCDGNSIGSSHQKLSLGSASKKIRCVEHTSSIDCDHRQLHHFASNLFIFTVRQSPRKQGSLWEQLRRRQEK